MKGFIEVTTNYRAEEYQILIPIQYIRRINRLDCLGCEIVSFKEGESIIPTQSYEEIKELIKKAQ